MENPMVYIRYKDHILFRNTPSQSYQPILRETIGWLQEETTQWIRILWDKSINKLPHQKEKPTTGLVILKESIVEIKKLNFEQSEPIQKIQTNSLSNNPAIQNNRQVGASPKKRSEKLGQSEKA